MSSKISTTTKPPLSVDKAKTVGKLTGKKTAGSSATAKHKAIHRSSSFSELDESNYCSRSSSSDSKLCKNIGTRSSNSATIARMEREINELRKENDSLKKELTEVRTLYDQLINEQPSECFNERRVLMLKSQIIQLERQLLLFAHSLENHSTSLLEANNKLEDLIEEFQTKSTSIKLIMTKEDLGNTLNQLDAIKKIINRPVQSSMENLAQPLLFLNSFINPSASNNCTCTLLDICCGRMDIINLKQVARLESKLAHLYQSLTGLQALLGINIIINENKEHLQGRLEVAKSDLQHCCCDLLHLSLLVPSAPWPSLKQSWDEFGFTVDSIIAKLPPFVRDKKEGKDVIHGAIKAFAYAHQMLQSKCNALTKELSFYESTCKLQTDYIESFYNSVIFAYKKFDEKVHDYLSQPLRDLLEAYDGLSQFASDEALKNFLSVIHDNHDKAIMNQLDGSASQGLEALVEFKKRFFDAVTILQQQHIAETR